MWDLIPPITKYLESLIGDVFTAKFPDCHFKETVFLTLGGESQQQKKDITYKTSSLSHLDPRKVPAN